ncbi:MAG: ATP-dependent RNA helicase HrpA, partial [Gammaproteobacteria bacterium]|nr:ATP-dependent RNA helicase HrpA [Gammaproteobacteria bacterium]
MKPARTPDATAMARRAERVPALSFPPELPISSRMDEIVECIRAHPVVIVAGETGSGKTTQLPKACLAAGRGVRGMIGHTQPRRLAARTVAARIAQELDTPLGAQVGFAVRFAQAWGEDTLVKVMTDGLLLAEIQHDRQLDAYDTLILDEAHERSLNVDFLVGYAKKLLRRRADFKLIVTSATIDVEAFQRHFDGAPVVSVGGRGHPVDVVWREEDDDDQGDPIAACLDEIARARSRTAARDVLVFLPGEREILETSQRLRRAYRDRYEVLPLYSRLPAREQARIFDSRPSARQRVILATNVAETSVTVPNVGYVIDSGVARISRYSFRSRIQRLPVEPISQASAEQRKGRCGRVAPGTCYRLYSEADYGNRPRYTDPELTRTNLASVVLQMRAFRLGDVSRFPFIDPPDPRAVKDAVRSLHELGALDEDRLTKVGRTMARLPVDPRLARMLIAAARGGCLREMLIVVAALSIQDPRERPPDRRQAADEAHRAYAHPESDFLAFVNLWNALEEVRAERTRSGFRRHLQRHFLSPSRVAEWRSLHRQLLLAARSLGMRLNKADADYAAVHRALLAGSLGFVGLHDEARVYQGARNLKFRIFPGSVLARKGSGPKWVVAAEIAETGQTYARCVARVDARWIEDAAGKLLRRSHSEPHWDARRGEPMVFERATLYGLPVVERRAVRLGPIDPQEAQALFVRHALVGSADGVVRAGKHPRPAFLDRNLALVRRIVELQAKGRRADVLASGEAQADFYRERLPDDVWSIASLTSWLAKADAAALERLEMTEADLMTRTDAAVSDDDFPSVLRIDGLELRLRYRFAPGEPDDGVSVRVDLGVLPHLRQGPLDWLVPGFFEQKCVELLKALPKSVRRRLAPVPDKAREMTAVLLRADRYREGSLLAGLAERVEADYGVVVGASDWRPDAIAPFLRLNVQVRGPRGRVVDQDRDLGALQARLLARVERGAEAAREQHEQRGLTTFPEDGVQETLTVDGRAGRVLAYPALRDDGDRVDLVLLTHRSSQRATNRRGYSRMALLSDRRRTRRLRRDIEAAATMALHYATLGPRARLVDELLLAAAWACFFAERALPAGAPDFEAALDAGAGRLAST